MKLTLLPRLWLPVLAVISIGLLIQRSLSLTGFNQHLLFVAIGLLLAFTVSLVDTTFLKHFTPHLYVLLIISLLATLAFAQATRGSQRWLEIAGVTIQPSELGKPIFILIFAQIISSTNIKRVKNIIKIFALALPPIILVLIQPDLGSAGIYILILLTLLFVSGVRYRHISLGAILALLASPLVWLSLHDYQKNRIYTFTDPSSDPLGKGYNAIQALISVGSGQLTGRGLGHGTQSKLRFLPEFRTDFVFASLAEELGFIGALVLISIFAILIWQIISICKLCTNQFQFLIVIGVAAMICSQFIINIGMNIGIFPITGITLPLISSGGSSILTTLVSIGLVQAIISRGRQTHLVEIH